MKRQKRRAIESQPSAAAPDRQNPARFVPENGGPAGAAASYFAGLDWLSFSKVKGCDDDFRAVARLLTSTGEEAVPRNGCEGIECAAYGALLRRGDSLLVDLPATALQYIRTTLQISEQQLCRWFLQRGFHATRADATIDTTDESVNPYVVWRAWERGDVTGTAQDATYHPGKVPKGTKASQGAGWTVYIGSKSSTRFMRVYDKAAEWRAKHRNTEHANFPRHLTRFELQHRNDAAQRCVQIVAGSGATMVAKLIAGWIEFKDPKHRRAEAKKRRAAGWWLALVGRDKAYLQLDPRAATPERTMRWLTGPAVARALAVARMYGQGDTIEAAVDAASIPATTLKRWEAVMGKPTSYVGSAESTPDKTVYDKVHAELFSTARPAAGHTSTREDQARPRQRPRRSGTWAEAQRRAEYGL